MKFSLFQPQAINELGQRTNQEDTIYPAPGQATTETRLFVVCDGMGGHDKGEVASAAVCKGISEAINEQALPDAIYTDEMLHSAVENAYATLNQADTQHAGRMGTTMTMLVLHKGGAVVAHIGDSRIYHLRPEKKSVLFRSRDHSLVQQLYDLGEISYNDMATHPRKNIILKAMQPYQDDRSKATVTHITDVRPGDYFYLCSDGMLEQMDDDELLAILASKTSDEEKRETLISKTSNNADNHSAYLIHIKDVLTEAGDELLKSDEDEARLRNKALNDRHKDKVWDYTRQSLTAETTVPTSPKGCSPERKRKFFIAGIVALAVIVCAFAAIIIFGGKKENTPVEKQPKNEQPNQPKVERKKDTSDKDNEEKEKTSIKDESMNKKNEAEGNAETNEKKKSTGGLIQKWNEKLRDKTSDNNKPKNK